MKPIKLRRGCREKMRRVILFAVLMTAFAGVAAA